jgi:glycerophosphoryl diester phosphodiesterase
LESDAWITADGMVVLDHDGVTGPLWRRRSIAAQPRAALPIHIPTLAELYETCGTDFEFSIDVKDTAALEPLLEVARAAGAAGRLWLCYHDWRPVAGWRLHTGEARLVESTRLGWIPEGLPARAGALHEAGIDAINLHRHEWTSELVEEVHAEGLSAFAWDAQSEADLARLIELGVDGLYSDHVGRMMKVIAAYGEAGSARA